MDLSQIKVVDLFCGAGGLSYRLKTANLPISRVQMQTMKPILLLSANCSISDRSKHLSVEELKNLFMSVGSRELSEVEKYVVEVIQSEAHLQEIESFRTQYNIPQERVDKLLSFNPYIDTIIKERLEEVKQGKVEMIHKSIQELESLEDS